MKSPINFKFELFDIEKLDYNFQDTVYMPKNKLGNFMMVDQKGFRFSQVIEGMLYYYESIKNYDDNLRFEHYSTNTKPYIIPVAVQYAPSDWSDTDHHGNIIPDKKSIFELINPVYLKDLQDGNAILLIDQSVEGYGADWLWQWFHNKCNSYSIDPAAILYLTGDQASTDNYDFWCTINKPSAKIKVIPSISLTVYLHKHYIKRELKFNFNEILDYKMRNKDSLYLFDCTNMRPRPHRVLNFLHLLNADLLSKGNISMPAQEDWRPFINLDNTDFFTKHGLPENIVSKLKPDMTPMIAKHKYNLELDHYYHYVERILDDLYRNSWVSLVVESSYFKSEHNAFISEKTFKPIAAMQPFMICGSQSSLMYLQRLGFKTFNPSINEQYSDLNDCFRFTAILNNLFEIEKINDKLAWYESMREPLEHNNNLFCEISHKKSREHVEIMNYYFEYFKDKNV